MLRCGGEGGKERKSTYCKRNIPRCAAFNKASHLQSGLFFKRRTYPARTQSMGLLAPHPCKTWFCRICFTNLVSASLGLHEIAFEARAGSSLGLRSSPQRHLPLVRQELRAIRAEAPGARCRGRLQLQLRPLLSRGRKDVGGVVITQILGFEEAAPPPFKETLMA